MRDSTRAGGRAQFNVNRFNIRGKQKSRNGIAGKTSFVGRGGTPILTFPLDGGRDLFGAPWIPAFAGLTGGNDGKVIGGANYEMSSGTPILTFPLDGGRYFFTG